MNHFVYDIARQQIDERTHPRHPVPYVPSEHRLRRRAARTLRQLADGLDAT